MQDIQMKILGEKHWKGSMGIALNSHGVSGGLSTHWDNGQLDLVGTKQTQY